jgi:geranylgeranyl diphosphate synthase type II
VAQKATYPSLWGIEESRRQAQQLIDSAIDKLASYGEKAAPLEAIAQYIINRKH